MEDTNFLRDNYKASGTQAASLNQMTGFLDSHTRRVKANALDFMVLYVPAIEGDIMYFVDIEPGMQLLSTGHGRPSFNQVPIDHFNYTTIRNEGYGYLLDDIIRNPKKHATMLDIAGEQYFTGPCLTKTLNARFNIPTDSTIERDFLFAQILDNPKGDGEYYCVVRRSGKYQKMFAIFSKKPTIDSFSDFVDWIEEGGHGKVLRWEFSHTDGLQVTFEYNDEVKDIAKRFPGLDYRPVHVFRMCDSGHYCCSAASGWMDGESIFTDEPISITGKSMTSVIAKNKKRHIKSAEDFIAAEKTSIICATAEDFAHAVIRHVGSEEIIAKKGLKKGMAELENYCLTRYQKYTNEQEIRKVALDAMRDNVFANVSESVDNWIANNAAGKIFAGVQT